MPEVATKPNLKPWDQLLKSYDVAVAEQLGESDFHHCLDALIKAGCTYGDIARTTGHDTIVVSRWHRLKRMPEETADRLLIITIYYRELQRIR